MNNSNTDPLWTNPGIATGDETTFGPCLVRAWHGMILAAYQGTGGSNGSGQMYTHIYDPYYGGNGWYDAQPFGNFKIVGGPAMVYFNRNVYFFFTDAATTFVYTVGAQPVPGQDNSLQFSDPIVFTPEQPVGYNSIPGGLAAAIFNSSVYLVWQGGGRSDGTFELMYAIAPLTNSGTLNFAAPIGLSQTAATSGVALSVFNNQLYGAYRGASGQLSFLIFSTGGAITNAVATDQNNQTVTCNRAPALTTDPAGQFMMAVFAESGGDQLYSSYLVLNTSGFQWGIPLQVGGHSTNVPPGLVATATGLAFLMYTREDSPQTNETNLTISNPLPLLWGVAG